MELTYQSVDHAYAELLHYMVTRGERNPSRNGDVLTVPEPVMANFTDLEYRVITQPSRQANPFLHLADGLFPLQSGNSHRPLSNIVKTMKQFSTDGLTLDGAYGNRLRSAFGFDQLMTAVARLADNPADRRVVMQMWGAGDLLNLESKDLPCNTAIMPRIVRGKLNLTIINRSNDLLWGLTGANMPQFAFLNEFMALALGIPSGMNTHVTNNLHMYLGFGVAPRLEKQGWDKVIDQAIKHRSIVQQHIPLLTIGESVSGFLPKVDELFRLMEADAFINLTHHYRFLDKVFIPMMNAHYIYRDGRTWDAYCYLQETAEDCNWTHAGLDWLNARI